MISMYVPRCLYKRMLRVALVTLGLWSIAPCSVSLAQGGIAELYTVSPTTYSHWYGGGALGERRADGTFAAARQEVLGSQFACADYFTVFLVLRGEANEQDLSVRLGLKTRPSLASGASFTLAAAPRFNTTTYLLSGDTRITALADPSHRADDTSAVRLLERRLLPTGSSDLSDAAEEEIKLLVSDVDRDEQLVISLQLQIACAAQARPKGALQVYLKDVVNQAGEARPLAAQSQVSMRAVENLRGLQKPLLTLKSVAQVGVEACPSLTEIRQNPPISPSLSEAAEVTLCHYMLNQGNAQAREVHLARVSSFESADDDYIETVLFEISETSEGDYLRPAELKQFSERQRLIKSTRFLTELRALEATARSDLFIPIITLYDADGDGLEDNEELRLGTNPFEIDSDFDGLNDALELEIGSPPLDGDADDDGVIDGEERSEFAIFNHDADHDGIFDGTEQGVTEPSVDTDLTRGHFRGDEDPTTTSDPLSTDSDGGGCHDSQEDLNLNGRVDEGESDVNGADDDVDTDLDGLCDLKELELGSEVDDADSDDDGLLDGAEPAPGVDTDGDGLINVKDHDSDDDGLSDGLERGVSPEDVHPDTDLSMERFTPDLDPTTTTDPLRADSDGGGSSDGAEDYNANGRVDRLETDPLIRGDDDLDRDGDLVPDGLDNCPQDENLQQADLDRDGRGDSCDEDRDGDGLYDDLTSQRVQGCEQHGTPTSVALIALLLFLLKMMRPSSGEGSDHSSRGSSRLTCRRSRLHLPQRA